MPSPFLLTQYTLPLLRAALEADYRTLASLTKTHPGTAAIVADITASVLDRNQSVSCIPVRVSCPVCRGDVACI